MAPRYARYDYLSDRALFSPRAGVTLTPRVGDSLKIRASVARREVAPGAEQFVPPPSGISLPPERTFSSVSRHGFVAERLDHIELAAEREWAGHLVTGVRVFRQTVDDQILTLFGGLRSRYGLGPGSVITTWRRRVTSMRAAGASA